MSLYHGSVDLLVDFPTLLEEEATKQIESFNHCVFSAGI